MTKVLAIVVNYRTADLVARCLHDLPAAAAGLDWRAVIVDSASGDDSVGALREAIVEHGLSSNCTLLSLQENRGFATGCNRGCEAAVETGWAFDFVHLLNPDTRPRPRALTELASFLGETPGAGIAGSRLEAPDGHPHVSAFRFPTIRSEILRGLRFKLAFELLADAVVAPPASTHAHPTDWVSGASLMIRRNLFEELGGLDERFFLYYEDTDLCARAARLGRDTWYVPASRVVHLGGRSTLPDASDARRDWDLRCRAASRRLYFDKNRGVVYRWLADSAYLGTRVLRVVRHWLVGRRDPDPGQIKAFFGRRPSPPAPPALAPGEGGPR